MNPAQRLFQLLAAEGGIVCAVGAGGKKSILRAIAADHPGRVALTGTVPFLPPPGTLAAERLHGEVESLAEQLARPAAHRISVFGRPPEKKGRWGGVPPGLIRQWHERFGFDVTLVKADGARMRWIKAPAEDEPLLPPGTDTVIPVLSARALGEPLSERIAHRVERVAQVTGCGLGKVFLPEHAARLLTSDQGLLQHCGPSRVRPVINMVDDADRQRLAEEAARLALGMTTRFDQVLLMRLKDSADLVATVTRPPPQRKS
jgi:probable selenium-dependent hydroxylase accessory protein YqeC